MLRHPVLTHQRIRKFLSEFEINDRIYEALLPVQLTVNSVPDRISYDEAVSGSFRPAQVGDKFGQLWSTHWFRVNIEIPSTWSGKEIHLVWDSGSESCVWLDGEPLQGLTGHEFGMAGPSVRKDFRVMKHALGGEKLCFYVEMACNGMFGAEEGVRLDEIGLLRQAEIAILNHEAWKIYWDLLIIADMAKYLPQNSTRAGQALSAANAIVNAIDLDPFHIDPQAFEIAHSFLASHTGEGQHHVSAIGHAHIDSAWLWPVAETQRKCIRTFSTAVRYMDDYPEYKFACSQAAQYEWIKLKHPLLYHKIKDRIHRGQFIPVGGSWIEPDCNVPSGESLVRQFLFGQRFFQQEFGITCHEFWSPDAFGYSAALPQILTLSEIKYFVSNKLAGNQLNKLPSHSFIWEGIDGAKVLAHFPPSEVYISEANVKDIVYGVNNFKDHDRSKESYLLFGWGDGGGGPTRGMLEQLRRMENLEGLPRVSIRSPEEFFQRLEEDIKDPLVWTGELYYERHRGTYTSQAKSKHQNRQSEIALHDVEFLSALAFTLHETPYPTSQLTHLWKLVLFNQFHDILPGSSIKDVYDDADRDYEEVFSITSQLKRFYTNILFGDQEGGNVCVANLLSFPRDEVIELPSGIDGQQLSYDGKALAVVSVPPMGFTITYPVTTQEQVIVLETNELVVMQNSLIRVVIDRTGHITSLFDLRQERECIAQGQKANRFILFDDHPNTYDAWDVDIFHLEKRIEVNNAAHIQVIEKGPLRASVELTFQLSSTSVLKQVISLTAISARLEFSSEVEWYENHKILKVEFPLNLRSQTATYEIQFGCIERPTHFNTTWDLARFEVCGQKWTDLSEPDYGVTLINDSKYGYSVHENIMRLSLLRAPKSPDPQADLGFHKFRYALLPHDRPLYQSNVLAEAFCFNSPLLIQRTNRSYETRSYFSISASSLVIDTLKKAEDSDDLIIRLYEAHGLRGVALFKSLIPILSAIRCNLLEREIEPVELTDDGIKLEFAPFQIITLKLRLTSKDNPKFS